MAGAGNARGADREKRLAVLISGRGSNLKALIDACAEGRVKARIAVVISNRPDAPGLGHARDAGIPHEVIDHRHYADREAFDLALGDSLAAHEPDLVVLAGFMRVLTPGFVRRFEHRMVNIHPSLLPDFRGLDTHARALEAGVPHHGASVHFVTTELDGGPVIMQARVPVRPGDTPATLAARVQAEEHRLYPAAVGMLCSGRVHTTGNNIWCDGERLDHPLLLDPAPEVTKPCAGTTRS
ncbi:MAG: phosphoribosylglycinamide formyltransferase [Thioalkalivibrio sp.]|nr:MAG: phosphoribosylglycinamide formyltransferase [Thioalkalivibrio sp.]